jgi:hypothetical protein
MTLQEATESAPDESVRDGQDEQDAVRSERRMLDAVARISDALASGRALAEVLEVICHEACSAFGVSDTILWLVEPSPVQPTSLPVTHPGTWMSGLMPGDPGDRVRQIRLLSQASLLHLDWLRRHPMDPTPPRCHPAWIFGPRSTPSTRRSSRRSTLEGAW